ncbi:MAG: hypothetical protein LAT57_06060 [Balneolales bacterium]|nr:hypothetical protein [Balneolales bacterium]
MAFAGLSACDRVSSGLETNTHISSGELPQRGATPLPDIGRQPPEVRITPSDDGRGKPGSSQASDEPNLDIDFQALRAYIESVADIFEERYVSVFIVADTNGAFYHYGYRTLNFHPSEENRSKAQREMYLYVLPNEDESDVRRMNVALIPRSSTAFDGYAQWLLPNRTWTPAQSSDVMQKAGSNSILDSYLECGWVTEYVLKESLSGDYYSLEIVSQEYSCAVTYIDDSNDELGEGGGVCWSCNEDGGGGVDVLTSCNGDSNAYWDPICPNRCVGGDTNREPALSGMDCDKICDYDNDFLDRMDTQAEIHRMWNGSYGFNNNPLPHSQRIEMVTFVNLYADGWEFQEMATDNVSSCHIIPALGTKINLGALNAIIHTHPFYPDEVIMDQRCYNYANSRLLAKGDSPIAFGEAQYRATSVSEADSNMIKRTGVPMYVVDKDAVRKIDPSNPSVYSDVFTNCWN